MFWMDGYIENLSKEEKWIQVMSQILFVQR